MNKKNVLQVGVFTAIGLWVLPLFLDALKPFEGAIRVIAMILLGGSVVLFVGYDAIMPRISKQHKENSSYMSAYDKKVREIRRKMENNEISVEEGLKQEKQLTEEALSVSKQQQELEKKRQQLKQTQNKSGSSSGGIDLGGLLGNNQRSSNTQQNTKQGNKANERKPDMLDNVMGAINGENSDNTNKKQTKKKQSNKNTDNLDDLRDLF